MSSDDRRPDTDLGIVYRSPQMAEVIDRVRKVARSDATVLILGESGTGKELVARAIHALSPRVKGPFCDIHLAALPETLVESELFGHVKGAFTGAVADRDGHFVCADGGTSFLDEVGEIPLHLQVKLLRVIQERKVRPVGGSQAIPFDARILCATNRDLRRRIEEGAFRGDLFWRISVAEIEIPPLREREGDIPLLLEHFLGKFSTHLPRPPALSYDAIRALCTYPWPGNVRELQNIVEGLVVFYGEEGEIGLREVEGALRGAKVGKTGYLGALPEGGGSDNGSAPSDRADQAQCLHHMEVLKSAGSISEAARRLGITRNTFKDRMKRWEGRGWVLRVGERWSLSGQK